MADVNRFIASLNSIKVGDLDQILGQLARLHSELQACGLDDQALILEQAQNALRGGRVPEFRKLLARATAELGHCRGRGGSGNDRAERQ
jgi:hypothetical protein